MADDLIDELEDAVEGMVKKWVHAYKHGTSGDMHESWAAWADVSGDVVQATYVWLQMLERCWSDHAGCDPGGGGSGAKGAKAKTKVARQVPHVVTGEPKVAPVGGLHPTAWLDGYGRVIGVNQIAVSLAPPSPNGIQHVVVTITPDANTRAGVYAGSVVDDEANIILDTASITIT